MPVTPNNQISRQEAVKLIRKESLEELEKQLDHWKFTGKDDDLYTFLKGLLNQFKYY